MLFKASFAVSKISFEISRKPDPSHVEHFSYSTTDVMKSSSRMIAFLGTFPLPSHAGHGIFPLFKTP